MHSASFPRGVEVRSRDQILDVPVVEELVLKFLSQNGADQIAEGWRNLAPSSTYPARPAELSPLLISYVLKNYNLRR